MNVHVVRAGMVPDVVDQGRSHLRGATAGPARFILVSEFVRVAQEVHDDGPVDTDHPG